MNEHAPQPGNEPVPPVGQQVESMFTPGDERAMQNLDLSQIAASVQAEFDALQPGATANTEPGRPAANDPSEVLFQIEATNELNQHDLGRAVDEATGLAPEPTWTPPSSANVSALAEPMRQLMPSGKSMPEVIEEARAAAGSPDFTQMRREYTQQTPEQQLPADPQAQHDKKGEQ